jgi:hypothetical protein
VLFRLVETPEIPCLIVLAAVAEGVEPDLTELKIWQDYRQELRSLTIACGSGAFLIAAFDYLEAEYKRVAAKRGKMLQDLRRMGELFTRGR